MAKTKEKKAPKAKKDAKAETAKEEEVKQEETEEKQEKKKTPKEGGGLLLTVLTILLVIVGVGELVLGAFMGFGTIRGIQAQRAYEAQLAYGAQLAESSGGPGAVAVSYSYAGPWLTVENGTVTWRREDDDLALGLGGTGQTIDPATGQVVSMERTYPRTPASPPAAWIKTIDQLDDGSVG